MRTVIQSAPAPQVRTWRRGMAALALAAAVGGVPAAGIAQGAGPGSPSSGAAGPSAPGVSSRRAQEQEMDDAWRAALAASVRGPAGVPLLDQAQIALPAGMIFVPKAEAARMIASHGGRTGSAFVGLITSPAEDEPWIVTINYVPEGYVKDDDAAKLDGDEILKGLRESNEEGNKDRVQRGFAALQLLGWTAPPAYDAVTHRLTWSLKVKSDDRADDEASINFNTRALGRGGYFSLNLVTSEERIGQDAKVSAQLLSGLQFQDGKRYTDFNSSTDRVAEIGLAGLIGVAAAKKLGLIAIIVAFAAKFAKVGILAVVGLGAVAARLFRRSPKS